MLLRIPNLSIGPPWILERAWGLSGVQSYPQAVYTQYQGMLSCIATTPLVVCDGAISWLSRLSPIVHRCSSNSSSPSWIIRVSGKHRRQD